MKVIVRDWSLITGTGGLQNGRGGCGEVVSPRKGGGKSLNHVEGRAQKVLGLFLCGTLKF